MARSAYHVPLIQTKGRGHDHKKGLRCHRFSRLLFHGPSNASARGFREAGPDHRCDLLASHDVRVGSRSEWTRGGHILQRTRKAEGGHLRMNGVVQVEHDPTTLTPLSTLGWFEYSTSVKQMSISLEVDKKPRFRKASPPTSQIDRSPSPILSPLHAPGNRAAPKRQVIQPNRPEAVARAALGWVRTARGGHLTRPNLYMTMAYLRHAPLPHSGYGTATPTPRLLEKKFVLGRNIRRCFWCWLHCRYRRTRLIARSTCE